MRETIDFGIDLGTTNSAIAVAENSGSRIIKNNDGWDYTPSAVWMPREGMTHVGYKARQRVESDPDDAHAEFKLQMGVAGAEYRFRRAGVSLIPEQLSAEVLKSLRQDVAHELGEPPAVAVITVPAAFALNQSSATGKAAVLAGLGEDCPLLHEPNAAALAYGVDNASDSVHWMVFDLGGGTFDAAVMSKRDGELQLLQHAGDPHLGGKDIDWAIVDEVLAPAAGRDLGLRDFVRGNPRWRTNFAKLKAAAEAAKIELSRAGTAELFVDLKDDSGDEQMFTYTLTRGALDDLALPFYTRAIGLCRKALADSSLRPDHIDRLLLVGGATLSPSLRELLVDPREGLGIQIDHSQDPSTVVARGAAIYAGTVRAPATRPRPRVGEFTADLVYEPQSLDTTGIPVAGTLHSSGQVDWTGYTVSLHNPDGEPAFHGPQVAVNANGSFYTTVTITPDTKSRFTVELTDACGVRQKLTPDTLSITHTNTLAPGPVLTHSLGIGKYDGSFGRILNRGAALPVQDSNTYRTTIALTRDNPDAVIRIPLLEGEEAEAKNNKEVGEVTFRRSDLRYDLPEGSEVEVTYEVRKIGQARAIVETMGVEFEAEVRLEGAQPEHGELVTGLRGLEQRAAAVTERVRESRATDAQAVLRKLSDDMARLRTKIDHAATDRNAGLECAQRLRDLQAQLDRIEREAVEAPRLMLELGDALKKCEGLLRRGGGAVERQELERLRGLANKAMQSADIAELERLVKQAWELCAELKRATGELEYDLFKELSRFRRVMTPRDEADAAIAQGKRAVAARDRAALGDVIQRLYEMLPPGVIGNDSPLSEDGGVR
ncbi:Hsp70 family protein [Streptomyces sp. TRM68367]|uniref:Hsp70 family protein n=1 Tax=Streptomyces sp. TRM68367 TaxID=2758415 RepID=UPI00165C17B7|nr:Hsp70 family protein [Streptomyces sp. TRM68367]MBC9727898.1 Hsp70 family protein [Streptomyces sp. TRM68367]